MRTLTFTILLVLAIGIAWQCTPIVSRLLDETPLRDSLDNTLKALKDPFSKDELIVYFKQSPTPESISQVKKRMKQKGIDTSAIVIRTCNACLAHVQLWQAPDIYTFMVTEPVRSGSGGGTGGGVGEDSLARYSPNYYNQIPVDSLFDAERALANYRMGKYSVNNLDGKEVVKVAVLDTGVDTVKFIHSSYLWTNEKAVNDIDDDQNCYTDDVAGWNFVDNTPNFHDDNAINKHGTMVTKYIIDQFSPSAKRGVQIMALKTLDATGKGSLFGKICALHYAINKGANIINASWGFYLYRDNPVPYFDSLVTQVMPQHGILFVTAAGNRTEESDNYASSIYRLRHRTSISPEALRNLQIHNFYPALFGREGNNVITTTTTNGVRVSPTQNFSWRYVDLGVNADQVTPAFMKFRMPFEEMGEYYISGSSFATSIATGKIGASVSTSLYTRGITKDQVFSALGNRVIRSGELDNNQLIRKGRYILRR